MQERPIDPTASRDRLGDPAAGAIATFEGRVRNNHRGRPVVALEYEAYVALAESEGAKIIDEAIERFDVLAAVAEHRMGRLEVGEVAVWVGVAAAHRGEAFAACRYVIDELKHRVAIWKKEHYADGTSEWTGIEGIGEPPSGNT